MKEKLLSNIKKNIFSLVLSKISSLKGSQFEKLVMALLNEAGFQNVVKQPSGFQGGYDIKGVYQGVVWRFEVKKTKGDALSENKLADKFDQTERNPENTEYLIIITNASIGTPLKDSINAHRNKWYIDLDCWAADSNKFDKFLLSYPKAVVKVLKFSPQKSRLFQKEANEYLKNNRPFIEEEFDNLLRTSNRFALLQRVANSISQTQENSVQPATEFRKLIERVSANNEFERFKHNSEYPCFILTAKEQMGKSSLMRLWAESLRKNNIVFFFSARDLCGDEWIEKFQRRVYPEIERLSTGKLQCPEYIDTILYGMQARLKSKGACIYVFVDALNAAQYEKVEDFFRSNSFNKSLLDWNFNWVFSCREAVWNGWRESIKFQRAPLEYHLREFSDTELQEALRTHSVDVARIPHWLVPKLKWPGLLRLYERIQFDKPDLLERMPEMTLAEMSLLFIKERIDDFSALHPGGIPITKEGIEQKLRDIVELFTKEGYQSLPFSKIQTIDDFDPYHLSENSWNILMQQGFLTKNCDNFELGNDWASILIGKYMVDASLREDVGKAEIDRLLDEIFDGIAPVATGGRIKLEESEKFTDILWFALHYGVLCNISEPLFRKFMDRIFEGQNLAHDYLSRVATALFPEYSVRYLASTTNENNKDLYIREGLENVPAAKVVPELIKLFPDASDKVKLQMSILLNHYKDIRYLNEVYSLLDRNLLPEEEKIRIHVKNKLLTLLLEFPDESCVLIHSRFNNGTNNNIDLGIELIGLNGTAEHTELLRKLINCQSSLSPISLRATGQLRMPEAEDQGMQVLENEPDGELKNAAIEVLGHLQSKRFLKWCQKQPDLWNREYYQPIVNSLQMFKTAKAYDLIIDMELKQTGWIPFFFFYSQNRLRRLNRNQFRRMVEGISVKIENNADFNTIWRGLHNISSLNSKRFKEWFENFHGTQVSYIIADLARFCAKHEYFDTRGQTLASMAMDEALKILDWIGDKKVFVTLLRDLMERDIPRLFAWTLVPYIIEYPDQRYKNILNRLASYCKSSEPINPEMSDLIRSKAITCLTYLKGNDVAESILMHRQGGWSKDENSLTHFKSERFIKKLIGVLKSKDEKHFWSAYCFLWDFLPEEAIEPSLAWLSDSNCPQWILKYLLRLLGKFDKPECNHKLIPFLDEASTQTEAMSALLYSKDKQVHDWFKKTINQGASSPVVISTNLEKEKHRYLIKWIGINSYRASVPYLSKWLQTPVITWLTGEWLIFHVYNLIGEFQFWDMLGSVKEKYYLWNPNWGSHVIEATIELIFKHEPDWAWSEFTKHWANASDFQKKNISQWVEFMPSKTSITWLLDTYPNVEKEIRQSIRKVIHDFPEEIKKYGIEALSSKAKSKSTRERIDATICSSLFGEKSYKKLAFLSEDGCSRVRDLYRYSDISESEIISQRE